MKKYRKIFKGLTASTLALLTFSVGMTGVLTTYSHYVNDYLGTVDTVLEADKVNPDAVHFKSDYFNNLLYNASGTQYTESEAVNYMNDKLAFIKETVGEGITLLKNNGVLPLTSAKKVTCLGRSSADLHYCASSGSGIIPTSNAITIEQAFSSVNVTANPTAYAFYKGRSEKYKTEEGGNKAAIGETPISAYTTEVTQSFKEYSDAAIVIFTRPGGEGNDLVQTGGTDFTGSQLNLNQDEKDVLNLAKETFEKVIVVLNTDNPIGIGDLKDDDKIDAIVWAGGMGINGVEALAELLVGKNNFSGKLPDTFATDSLSSAAAQNCGSYKYTNADEITAYVKNSCAHSFVVEAEGIYIGYKYYETRYEDCVLGGRSADNSNGIYASSGKWNYSDEMGYTFGYGLSYTEFDQTLSEVTFNDDKSVATVKVNVKNTGSVAGKDVVQIWFQSPYTDYDMQYGVEKSAIQLADYIKTDILQPGESATYTVEVEMANCASFDSKGAGTYIMDAGTYYFALGNGAHEGLNNVLAAKGYTSSDGMDADGDESKTYSWVIDELDAETYSKSRWTGEEINAVFGDADLNYWQEGAVTYLTRSDWNTFPKTYDTLTATEEMITALACNESITGEDFTKGLYDDERNVVYDSKETNISLYEMFGKDFDDPMWDSLLDQLSMRETSLIVGIGNCETVEIESINKGKTMGGDGPTGFAGIIKYQTFNGAKLAARCYCSETLISGTWNKECSAKFGYFLGEDGLFLNKTDLWGPGANLHRTPFSGRNNEYPSEDGILGFEQLAAQCNAMYSKGLIAAPKHFAFNDQESGRNGLSTFVLEQSAREIILKIYEGAFTEGNARGTMSAFPRIGLTYIGTSYALLRTVLRGEWGFKGYITTDMAGTTEYMRPVEAVKSGVTLFDNNSTQQADILYEAMPNDTTLQKAARDAAHYTLYAFANSNAMNGYDENVFSKAAMPWWQVGMITLDVVLGILFASSVTLYAISIKKEKDVEEVRV